MDTGAYLSSQTSSVLRKKENCFALTARSKIFHAPFGSESQECVKLVVVRFGAATITTDLGSNLVREGDCLLVSPNVLFEGAPKGSLTATTIYVDTNYFVDQVFWQYSNSVCDRFDALEVAGTLNAEPVQILKPGFEKVSVVSPWLDELTQLSDSGGRPEHFHRVQALWSSTMDVLSPLINISSVRNFTIQRSQSRPVLSGKILAPARGEAVKVREMLRKNPQEQWTLYKLAEAIHLSPKQLSRVFSATYGKTPLAYLTIVRVEEMARLLRQTSLPIGEVGRLVGWNSRSRACQAFRECTEMTPKQYRKVHQESGKSESDA
ncbi:helix-turn-helix transcriptional regulator [Brevibacterium sp. Re57]|uniref:Helix-turn-helix transcriptional regulator n=1 Tax=Brevibacterium gallinarum TaxID=2762220 RepID=A0ABR8WW94_9MICO|nr:helix-turn-helix transcriptional regulator [Brevibacterium gallinarum]